MVITLLKGGLGNQMFQYAAGFAVAKRTVSRLALDLSYLNKNASGRYTQRKFELPDFNISAREASGIERWQVKSSVIGVLTGKKYRKVTDTGCDPEQFRKISGDMYLNGFWQHEDYFRAYRKELLHEFRTVKELPSELVNQLREKNTVAIHVRRGDYVTFAAAANFHGTLRMDYYKNAVNYLEKKAGDLRFYIFSDDPAWCREAFEWLPGAIIHEPSAKPATDLALMSTCAHQVIANSSFSWWAAWLNNNPHKMVVAPKQWYAVTNAPPSPVCSDWILI